MTAVLLDTHAWAWALNDSPRLSGTARAAIEAAEAVDMSPVSFFEIAQKVRLGKWPEMSEPIGELPQLLVEQGGSVLGLTPDMAVTAGTLDRAHRDPFDRLPAATSLESGIPLLSADVVFDRLNGREGWRRRLW